MPLTDSAADARKGRERRLKMTRSAAAAVPPIARARVRRSLETKD